MYLVVDPVLDWVRESYTPQGKLEKEISHALDQASQLQVEDLYKFRDQHINKKELDPRFRPTAEEFPAETPGNTEASRSSRVDQIRNFYKHYDFTKSLQRQEPSKLLDQVVITRWIKTFTPSPDDPLDLLTQKSLAQSSEAFLLSLHQIDTELTRYFNGRIQNSKDNPFRNTLTLEPYVSEVVARHIKKLVDSFESGELGIAADSTLRVGLQQILEQAFVVESSQLVLINHFGEAKPSRADLEALLDEQITRRVWEPLKTAKAGISDGPVPTDSSIPVPNHKNSE
jgi:hypothetical protein